MYDVGDTVEYRYIAAHVVEREPGVRVPDYAVPIVWVGDDHTQYVDPSDLEQLSEGDYCHSCGQLGCVAVG